MLLSKTRRALGDLPIGAYKEVYQEMEEIAEPKDYDEIVEILDKKNKTAFEKFVSASPFKTPAEYYEYYRDDEYKDTTRWDRNKVLDCKASWYIRNHELEAALKTLQQIPDNFWKNEPYKSYIGGDPFYLNVYNPHKITANDKINSNKKEVISRMLNLEALAKRDPSKAAECYYQLANAYYNMSWHGKNWLMVKQWWTSGETSSYNVDIKRTPFNDDYYGTGISKEYYLKALKETKDQKLATLCCYMAGQCDKNFKQYIWNIKNKGNYDAEFTPSPNPYVKALRQKGVDEGYYREIVKECHIYNSYIQEYNRRL